MISDFKKYKKVNQGGKEDHSATDQQVEDSYRVTGQLTMEKDFSANRLGH